jgi:hypothetical protein
MNWTKRLVLIVVLLGPPSVASAQTIVDSLAAADRTIDWSRAGVTRGIPHRTTVCTTLGPGTTAAAINNAIAACNNGVVALSAGTYTLSSGITFRGANNVTLRGAGPDRTVVKFTGSDSCGGLFADVCVHGPSDTWSGNVPSSAIRNWTAGYEKGATQIMLDSAAGLSVGQVVILDQRDDGADTRDVFVCASRACSQEGGPAGRAGRAQQQYTQVTAISGNQVTISPGLYMVNWRSSQQPQLWWWGASATMNGVEGLTLDHSASPAQTGIGFQNAYNCWVKNVKSLNGPRNHVWLNQAARIEVRDSYFFGTRNAASLSYGVELFGTSDSLVVNNIFHRVTAPIMTGNSSGAVVAYNFMTDMVYTVSNWMMAGLQGSHDAGTGMNLVEGNVGNGFVMDNYHGTGNLITLFRNRLTGTEGSKSSNTIPVNIFGYNRLVNVVGNVLGTAGYHQIYEHSQTFTAGSPDRSIYVLGYAGVGNSNAASLPYDTMVRSTLVRWGNFDLARNRSEWNPSELPSTLDVPSGHALPPSLFLSARPGWWGATPWPAIGPDVSGGADGGGHAHKIPAQVCFEGGRRNADGTLAFDAMTCYPQASAPSAASAPSGTPAQSPRVAPSAPANLVVD